MLPSFSGLKKYFHEQNGTDARTEAKYDPLPLTCVASPQVKTMISSDPLTECWIPVWYVDALIANDLPVQKTARPILELVIPFFCISILYVSHEKMDRHMVLVGIPSQSGI